MEILKAEGISHEHQQTYKSTDGLFKILYLKFQCWNDTHQMIKLNQPMKSLLQCPMTFVFRDW